MLLWIPFSAYPLYHSNTFSFFLLQHRETNANKNRLRASYPASTHLSKVFEDERGGGFGGGEKKLSTESFFSPSPDSLSPTLS